MKTDLHIHTTASDGKKTPEEIVDWALEKGLKRIAITDHEVVDGSLRAIRYSEDKDIEIISGVEFGANVEELGVHDVHIVGLFLDLENQEVGELSQKLMDARRVQKEAMILKLNELGYEISFEELEGEVEGINYGRPHIAKILMRRYDEFEDTKDVFNKLLGFGGKANVVQWKESMKNTIDIIHGAGGVAVLAHPILYDGDRFECDVGELIKRFIECGGDGIEMNYSHRNVVMEESWFEEVDGKINEAVGGGELVVSGGGDFHREGKGFEIGDYGLTEEEFLVLEGHWKEKWKKN